MPANRTVAVELKALVSGYVAGMKQAAQATSDLANKAGKQLTEHSAEVSRLGTTFALTGAGMLLVAGKAVKTFSDFDKAMSRVAATGDDAKASLGQLRELAIKLGADTQFSAQEAADGIAELLKAGVQAKDVLGGGLAGALNLAAAGQMSVADAAETTAITMAQFNLAGDQASHVADLLAAGSGKASGEVHHMAEALRQVGLVANQTGLSVEETTGTLAAFAKAGLIGSDSGTSLKTALQRLTPQSAEAQKEFDRLGISAYDSSGKFVGLANFAGQLQDKLGGLSPKARNAALNVMFGSDAVRAATELYKQGATGIQGWIDQVNDQGFAARKAAELTNNLAGDLERLGGSLDSAFIKSGSGANAVLRRLAQGAEAAVDAIGGMPEPLLNVVTLLAGSGGLAALGVGGLLKVAAAASDARTSFRNLGVSAKTAKVAVAGIATAFALGSFALAAWADSQAQAASNAEAFASTLVIVDGKVTTTSATLSEINQKIIEMRTGLFGWGGSLTDLMSQIGVSTEDAQGYIAGNEDAINRVAEATRAYEARITAESAAMSDGRGEVVKMMGGLDALRGSLTEAQRQTLLKAEADRDAGVNATSYAEAVLKSTEATQGNTAATSENASILNDWISKQWAAAEAALALSGSQVGFERTLDQNRAAMKKLVKETKDKTDLTNVDTKAGQDAKTILDQTATSTLNRVKAMQKAKVADSQVSAEMERGRKAFVAQARAAGFSETAIARLVDKYDLLPENVTTKVDEDGSSAAEARVHDFFSALKKLPKKQQAKVISEFNRSGITAAERALNAINGKTAYTRVVTEYERRHNVADGGMFQSGLGGLIQQFAGGGTWGQPQVRPFQGAAGVNWGEAGSGPWEAFISGAPQKRDRSIAIWREVGRRLLGDFSAADVVAGFASGGIIEPTYQGKPISYWQTQLKTPLELTQLQIQIRDLKAELAAKVGKGRKRRDRLRGLERTEAQQRLAEAEDEYRLALLAKQANESQQGTLEAQTAAWEAQKGAADAASRWQQQYMTGSSAADLLANMQAGAGQISAFNDLLGQLDAAGLSDQLMAWLWDQGPSASDMAKQILGGGQSLIDAFNQTSGNLSKAADAAGQSEATGAWVRSPVLSNVNLPGYMTSGANGAVVSNKTINFNVTQTDPYTAVVYFDQQLRYL